MRIRSLLKLLLIGLPILIIGIAVVSYAFRNPIVETAVERGGQFAVGVNTEVGAADLQVGDRRLSLEAFTLANPDGFERPGFLTLGRADMKIGVASLFGDTAHIEEIVIDSLELELSRRGGSFNYQTILKNIEQFESSSASNEGKYKVDAITITHVSALIALMPGGGELTRGGVTIEEITISNLGTHTQSLAGLTSIVVQGVLKAITQAGGAGLPDQLVSGLKVALGSSNQAASMNVSVRGVKTTGALDKIRMLTNDLLRGKIDLKEDLKDLDQGLFGGDKN